MKYDLRKENPVGRPIAQESDEDAELLNIAGNSTRLRLLYLLENIKELRVGDLAEMLGISVSAVSQHLAKLKDYGLVAPRREAQTIYYRMTDHSFNKKLRDGGAFSDGGAFRQLETSSFVGRQEVAEPPVRIQERANPAAVRLKQLHNPESGRLDADQMAHYLSIGLKRFSEALGKNYSTVHKTPDAPALQPTLRSIKRSLEILEDVLVNRAAVLAWLNSPHPDLGRRTPLDVILQGYPDAVEDMLEGALIGTPS